MLRCGVFYLKNVGIIINVKNVNVTRIKYANTLFTSTINNT